MPAVTLLVYITAFAALIYAGQWCRSVETALGATIVFHGLLRPKSVNLLLNKADKAVNNDTLSKEHIEGHRDILYCHAVKNVCWAMWMFGVSIKNMEYGQDNIVNLTMLLIIIFICYISAQRAALCWKLYRLTSKV